MKVLVLGGSYFVGAAIAVNLTNAGHEVLVANRGTRPPPDPRMEQVIFDRSAGGQQLPAADAIVDVSCFNGQDANRVLEALAEIPDRYVLISSAAVYGPRPAGERHVVGDPTPGDPVWGDYGTEKADAEAIFSEALGRKLTTLRPPYIYGPGNNLDRESFIWDRLYANRPVLIPGDGSARLQFCHSDDLGMLVERAISGPARAGTYNVGERSDYSIKAWIELLGAIAEKPVAFVEVDRDVPARSYFPFRNVDLVLDPGEVEQAFEMEFRSLRSGLDQTLGWYLEQKPDQPALTEMEQALDGRAV